MLLLLGQSKGTNTPHQKIRGKSSGGLSSGNSFFKREDGLKIPGNFRKHTMKIDKVILYGKS